MDPADSLDTATLTAGTRGWSGVQNRQKPGLLDVAALAVLVNGRLDDTGSVQLRPGTEWLCQPIAAQPRGLFYYDVDTAEAILACVDGKVYEIPASTGPVQPIRIDDANLATSGRCRGAQLVDKFAIADGLRLLGLWREAGAWQTMQVATFTGGQALPAVRGVVAHNFRLIIWGGTGATAETLYASGVLEPWKFGAAEGIRVGRGEGDPIVVALPGPQQTLFVGKGGSWWQVDLTGAATEWSSSAITHQRGCWAADTAVVVNQDVLFLCRDGVANLAKLANDAPVSPVDLISAPIEATIKRINWTAARRTACATMWGGYYLLAVPLDGAQRNNTVLAYNTTTQQWSGEWTGWAPEAWCQSKFDGQLATILADRTGNVVRLDSAINTDGNSAAEAEIPLELETAAFSFEAPDLLKQPMALDCEWRAAAATVDVTLRSDGGSPQTIREDYDATPESGGINRRLIANLRELRGGRELQIRMVTAGGAFGLRELTLKAMPLRARWEAPPAELLVPPLPTDDNAGTPTELRDENGQTMTLQLQEIDTITLPHDSLDFVCFRGGLSIPAGNYVIAYRRGNFRTRVAPEVSDLPAPTGLTATGALEQISAAWDAATDERVVGFTIYVDGAVHSEVAAPAFSLSVPGGGTRTLAVFSRAADGTLSANSASVTATAEALPPPAAVVGFATTAFAGIAPRTMTVDTTGWGWVAPGQAYISYYLTATDGFSGLPEGALTDIITGRGWSAPGQAYISYYLTATDGFSGLPEGALTDVTTGSGWAAPGLSTPIY